MRPCWIIVLISIFFFFKNPNIWTQWDILALLARHSQILRKTLCQDKFGMIMFSILNLLNKNTWLYTIHCVISSNVYRSEQYPQQTFLFFLFIEYAHYYWFFQLMAHSICAPFSCLTLNAATLLGCQHYTTFPRTAVSFSLFCYLFKIRIRRCVLISMGLTAVCFTHDGPRNTVLVLLIHMGFWDITQVLYNNSSELSTVDYNLKHCSSLNKSCLCLMRLWSHLHLKIGVFRRAVLIAITDWNLMKQCRIPIAKL